MPARMDHCTGCGTRILDCIGQLHASMPRFGRACTQTANSRPTPLARGEPQALFHALLSAPHWAVRAAALDALVLYSRTSAVHGTFLTLIPPAAMAGPAVSSPEFVAVFKAHMGRVTDEQVGRTAARRGAVRYLAARFAPLQRCGRTVAQRPVCSRMVPPAGGA